MKWVLAIGLALALGASYARAAPPEGLLGQTLRQGDFAQGEAARGRTPGPRARPLSAAAARRYVGALGGLRAEGSVTRGAKEARIYQEASPSVVLIVTDEALGSGAVIDPSGLIVTNLHVVGNAKEVGVVFKPRVEGQEISKADIRRARVLRRDEIADLALVKVDAPPAGLRPLAVAGADAVQVGADVHAIGHPTGETWTYTRGIVSQIRKDYTWRTEDKIPHKATVIQTQTPINPGNSGGPLLDDQGELVGINSFKGEGEGLNFAVSADDVKAFLARSGDRLAEGGHKALASRACEATPLKKRRIDKPVGTEFLMDSDCDGKGDYALVVPDDPKLGFILMYDQDGDGKIDTLIYDDDRDGHPDYAEYDTDGDGKPDLIGRYRKGEDEPYLYEKMKK